MIKGVLITKNLANFTKIIFRITTNKKYVFEMICIIFNFCMKKTSNTLLNIPCDHKGFFKFIQMYLNHELKNILNENSNKLVKWLFIINK